MKPIDNDQRKEVADATDELEARAASPPVRIDKRSTCKGGTTLIARKVSLTFARDLGTKNLGTMLHSIHLRRGTNKVRVFPLKPMLYKYFQYLYYQQTQTKVVSL